MHQTGSSGRQGPYGCQPDRHHTATHWTLEGRYAAYLGEDELLSNNPLRSPMSHGVFVALSTDILPLGPLVGIRAAVTRNGMSGTVHAED